MLTPFQAIVLGLLQGVTELFPISSLGHSVVLPRLLGWTINQDAPFFLTFLVATHTATALVLFFYFFNDWKQILSGMYRSLKEREIKENDKDAKLGWLLVVATVPAGILGILFQDSLQSLFANPQLVAGVLFFNGLMLLGAEILRRRKKIQATPLHGNERIAKLTWSQAVKVGILQCVALIPGFSRTGATLTGGLLEGLSHEDAARFAFLLATPIIGAASVLKLPELAGSSSSTVISAVIGAITAGIAAFLSVKFLTKYFQTNTLTPFAVYCMVVGVLLSLLFFLY